MEEGNGRPRHDVDQPVRPAGMELHRGKDLQHTLHTVEPARRPTGKDCGTRPQRRTAGQQTEGDLRLLTHTGWLKAYALPDAVLASGKAFFIAGVRVRDRMKPLSARHYDTLRNTPPTGLRTGHQSAITTFHLIHRHFLPIPHCCRHFVSSLCRMRRATSQAKSGARLPDTGT